MHVWGYWKCPYCGTVVRADNRNCPSCGTPIPDNTKFFVDETKAMEYVPPSQESDTPNWICEYCNSQNRADALVCEGCGAPKSESKRDYFGSTDSPVSNNNTNADFESEFETESESDNTENSFHDYRSTAEQGNTKASFIAKYGKIAGIITACLLVILSLIWLFTPVSRVSTIESFSWSRIIAIEEFKKCRESDWSLPAGAELVYTRLEVHHYVSVFDHYEKKSKQVATQEPDGYTYKDLGNGQFDEVPKYKTVYKTEYYTEAVYRDEPVYQTKYYYDIGRYKKIDSINTSGVTQEPYWGECDYPQYIAYPKYGDYRQGDRTEEYYAVVLDEKGNLQRVKYSQAEWEKLEIGQEITYKTFRFSDKPL